MSNIVYSTVEGIEIPELIAQIKEIMAENEAHNLPFFSETMWRWRYMNLPSGKSFVYIARCGGEIVGYYHVPIYKFIINGIEENVAMVQDVAIRSQMRGQGIFRKLADFAHQHFLLENVRMAYTFPNIRSIHTFLKYNEYTQVSCMPVFIKPLNSAAIIRSKLKIPIVNKLGGFFTDNFIKLFRVKPLLEYELQAHNEISPEIEALYQEFLEQYPLKQKRDANWLKWRFVDKPGSHHFICTLNYNDKPEAAAIFKLDVMLENKALLLLDFAFKPGKVKLLLQLIQEVIQRRIEIFNAEINLVFTSGLNPEIQSLKKIGFIRIPKRFVPRKLNLLARNINYRNKSLLEKPENWHVTLADWDVF